MSQIKDPGQSQNQLDDVAKRFQDLDAEASAALPDIVTDDFVSRHTSFATLDEMFTASGFQVETQEDFAALPVNEWNEFIRSVSGFDGWQSMLGAAGQEWARRKLGL